MHRKPGLQQLPIPQAACLGQHYPGGADAREPSVQYAGWHLIRLQAEPDKIGKGIGW